MAKGAANPNQSPALSKYRDARILELLGKGYTHQQIGEDLGIERSAVSRRAARLGQQAGKQIEGLRDQVFLAQYHRLEFIINEAMDGWRRSREPLRRVSKVQLLGTMQRSPKRKKRKSRAETSDIPVGSDGENGEPLADDEWEAVVEPRENVTTYVEERAGNTAYLEAAMAAMDRQRRLLGLDAPFKIAPTTPDGHNPYAGLPTVELQKRVADQVRAMYGTILPPEVLDLLEQSVGMIDVTPHAALPVGGYDDDEEEDEP